jgi:hypothetical protein
MNPTDQPPLEEAYIFLTHPPGAERLSGRPSGHTSPAVMDKCLHVFKIDGCSRYRKRWDQCMGCSALPAADPQYQDQMAVVVFLIHPVAGKAAIIPALRTAFFPEKPSPEHFYPVEAIFKNGTAD